MSHDWPVDITQYGDVAALLKYKPTFRSDIEKGELGSPPMMDLLQSLRPRYWFSAHMHCKFEAFVNHGPESAESGSKVNPHGESGTVVASASAEKLKDTQPLPNKSTYFLALDKCLPKRPYMHILDLNPVTPGSDLETSPPILTFDREWLAISRALHPYLSTRRQQPSLPPVWDMARIIQESQLWVDENVGEREIRNVQEFTRTAPGPVNTNPRPPNNLQPPPSYRNPQTEAFCAMLGLDNKVNPPPTK
ncbi:unnamed protein product [Rhizoctonia solani]|uniref:Lariat debranching enzyme C-terminal domain-containing protein n=1 Tax=Rhizoctonia solani TaxID=456999 RepID=A0A8H3H7A7_9AGAM|nr:unnamed protein product [Rhizoctonia solani]